MNSQDEKKCAELSRKILKLTRQRSKLRLGIRDYNGTTMKLHSKSAPISLGDLIQGEWITPTGLIKKPKQR